MDETIAACPLTRGKRILVALDGSMHSEKALDQALSLAKVCNSKLFLVSVLNVHHELLEESSTAIERMSNEVRTILDQGREKAKEHGLDCETIVHIGANVHEFIVQEAKAKEIDLIVMGTRGRTGLKGLLMGSVARKVLCSAPCAVLVTPL